MGEGRNRFAPVELHSPVERSRGAARELRSGPLAESVGTRVHWSLEGVDFGAKKIQCAVVEEQIFS